MKPDANPQTFPCSEAFARQLGDREFREGYLEDQVRTNVAFQIHALRRQRGWTQQQLAEKSSKLANGISRLENPDYGKVSLTTLLEIAAAFDVALLVQFAEWDDFLERMADVSPSALQKRSFDLSRLVALARPRQEAMQQVSDKSPEGLGGGLVRPPLGLPSAPDVLSDPQGRRGGRML
jgi:transcriptional regulator with XRE-family HTH domain